LVAVSLGRAKFGRTGQRHLDICRRRHNEAAKDPVIIQKRRALGANLNFKNRSVNRRRIQALTEEWMDISCLAFGTDNLFR
jgi:hypothetical protein